MDDSHLSKNHKIEKGKKKKKKKKKKTLLGPCRWLFPCNFPKKVSLIFSLGRFRKTRTFQGSPP